MKKINLLKILTAISIGTTAYVSTKNYIPEKKEIQIPQDSIKIDKEVHNDFQNFMSSSCVEETQLGTKHFICNSYGNEYLFAQDKSSLNIRSYENLTLFENSKKIYDYKGDGLKSQNKEDRYTETKKQKNPISLYKYSQKKRKEINENYEIWKKIAMCKAGYLLEKYSNYCDCQDSANTLTRKLEQLARYIKNDKNQALQKNNGNETRIAATVKGNYTFEIWKNFIMEYEKLVIGNRGKGIIDKGLDATIEYTNLNEDSMKNYEKWVDESLRLYRKSN